MSFNQKGTTGKYKTGPLGLQWHRVHSTSFLSVPIIDFTLEKQCSNTSEENEELTTAHTELICFHFVIFDYYLLYNILFLELKKII